MNIETKQTWADKDERGAYLGLRFLFFVYRVLGRFVFSVVLIPVMIYFVLFGGDAKRASADFLTRVHANAPGRMAIPKPPGFIQVVNHFISFGDSILDKIAAWTGDIKISDVCYENRPIFQAIVDKGQGGVIITSHLGNTEVCRALGQIYRGLDINVLVHTKHASNFNRVLNEAQSDSSVNLIQVTEIGPETAVLLSQKISQGEFIVIVADRVPASGLTHVEWVDFLGESAAFPHGPFILSALLQCPVCLLFCIKVKGSYHMIFEEFADRLDLPRSKRKELLAEVVQKFVSRLEYHALRYPYQWFNFFDFWAKK